MAEEIIALEALILAAPSVMGCFIIMQLMMLCTYIMQCVTTVLTHHSVPLISL
jgi:hypothetical protein